MDDRDELPPPAAAGLKRERADRAVTEQTSGGKRSKTQLHGDGSQHKAALRAACCGDLRALRQLPLEALLHVGNHGVTPMVLAAKHGHGEWIRALAGVQSQPPAGLWGGRGLAVCTRTGWSLAHVAAANGHPGVLRVLHELGVSLISRTGWHRPHPRPCVRGRQQT
eukprot:COSAG06_NODE_16383_length_1004_cov_1.045304_1_plen_166_part_00